MEKTNDKAICQNCKSYTKPRCSHRGSGKEFVPRKGSCEWFKQKRK